MSLQLKKTLEECRQKIDDLIKNNIHALGDSSRLRDACEYALLNGGKRFRPALVLLVAKALKTSHDLSYAALAIEYFHTASLIADDLPCMDDDSERRNKPSVHIAFNEATALMASYALISAGYGLLAKNAQLLVENSDEQSPCPEKICRLAIENVSFNTGLLGATGGQYMDINPPNLQLNTLKEIACKKTTSLFEISFVLGWLFAGGDLKLLPKVKKAAHHFGLAFQIGDDIGDMEQDKQNGRLINIASAMGPQEAKKLVANELELYKKHLIELDIASPELLALAQFVNG